MRNAAKLERERKERRRLKLKMELDNKAMRSKIEALKEMLAAKLKLKGSKVNGLPAAIQAAQPKGVTRGAVSNLQ